MFGGVNRAVCWSSDGDRMKILKGVSVLSIFLLAGCAGQPSFQQFASPPGQSPEKNLVFDTGPFGQPRDILRVEDIYRLSAEQEAEFLTFFNKPAMRNNPAHQRVWLYLQEITMDFGYQGATYTAEEALRRSSGNCLSLAVLTTALAKLAGVETGYQLVDSTPVFESYGNVVFKAQHVRTKLLEPVSPQAGVLVLSRRGLLVDYFPQSNDRFVSNISEAEYNAMFYNNLAGEAIADEDYNQAFWLLQKSLELVPDNPGSINAMAVVHRRVGQLEKAEEIFLYGIENFEDKISLLRNYRVLLEQQGRFDEVKNINRNLALLKDPSPFDWLNAGHDAFGEGNFSEAAFFYRKAVTVAPYLHESHAGLAKAYYKIGKRKDAEREFRKALENSQRQSTRSMYEAKLMALSGNH
jgi:Tfp pilus assembly protein PilF